MNPILQLILLVFMNIFQPDYNKPVRLGKKQTASEKVNNWIYRHYYELLIITIFILLVILALAIFTFVGPVESGNYYNHIKEVA